MELADLVGVRGELADLAAPEHDRRDHVPGAGGVVVEQPEHGVLAQREPDLLEQLAAAGLGDGLARVGAAAGQRPLPGVPAQGGGPPGEQEGEPVGEAGAARGDQRDRDGGALQVRALDRPPLEPRQPLLDGRAQLRDATTTRCHAPDSA
ncbi:hypothetical protein GCM10017577_02350 [Pseudonocardia halophobica]|uniref:Uncharacterized protein n=1 Tax=Pseudonocardia halophobica TaxID=29401 RepID=A0A9W6KZ36_9PSEU|nr:hypothetical protein GCM10017577_02350 [Pseudonocardia halophobica]